jgi:hypothetical protein
MSVTNANGAIFRTAIFCRDSKEAQRRCFWTAF